MKLQPHKIGSSSVPVIFTDGTAVYNQLAKTYVRHSSGLFVLAPSGTGKTYFVEHQAKRHWIDGDLLWTITGADYTHDEWDDSLDDIFEVNGRCDTITHQAKKLGFWIVGSSNLFLQPDAIVIPEWDTHLHYIQKRESNSYDGGATTEDLEGLRMHIDWIVKTWEGKVPFFTSIEAAVNYLVKDQGTTE